MILNRHIIITFQPKDQEKFGGKRRFSVGVGTLKEYVGEQNAKNALRRAIESGEDKYRVQLRKQGIIDFYFK